MNLKLIQENLKKSLEIINSPEYDEGDFTYLEGLLDEALKESGVKEGETSSYTVLSGEAYEVTARSEGEALAKFYVAYGHAEVEEYEGEGYDFSTVNEDVMESETRSEVIA